MRILLLTSILILVWCITSFAQINEISPCPAIYVTGPSSVPKLGDSITYSAIVSKNAENYKLKYIWTVSGGEILEGQGTAIIQSTFDYNKGNLATVKIEGLPENCQNSASEVAFIDKDPESKKFNEFALADFKLNKGKNDKLIDVLNNDPSLQLYVIFYFKDNSSQKSTNQKMRQVVNLLINKNKIGNERITELKAFSEKQESVQFWLIPTGAMPPTPENK